MPLPAEIYENERKFKIIFMDYLRNYYHIIYILYSVKETSTLQHLDLSSIENYPQYHNCIMQIVTQKARTIIYKTIKIARRALLFIVYQPCLCLCLGFSQITLILPFLLIILHFSQIGFTDDLTFTVIHSFQKKSVCNYIIIKIFNQVNLKLFY